MINNKLSDYEENAYTYPAMMKITQTSLIINNFIFLNNNFNSNGRIASCDGQTNSEDTRKEGQEIIFDFKNHPVLQGFVSAYKNHRPVTISPDIIWLLIVQAFSNHITNNAEKLRSMFVNFAGKKDLTLERPDLNIFQMTSEDFEREVFPEFVKQISEYTGPSIIDTMTPNFTTTTTVSFAVSMISIMSAMKNYFNYKFLCRGCGFPYVTIEGSVEDLTKISLKLNDLKKYDFEWFKSEISDIINKIIDTKKGCVDLKFWKEIK